MPRYFKASCFVEADEGIFQMLDCFAKSNLDRAVEGFLMEYAEDMEAYGKTYGHDDVDRVNNYIKDTWCEGDTLENLIANSPNIHVEVDIDSNWEDDDWLADNDGFIDIETVAIIFARKMLNF
jgi:hypothetical protein